MQSNLYFPDVESIFPQLVLSDSIFEWRKNEIEHTHSVNFINIGRKINNRVKENEKRSNNFFSILGRVLWKKKLFKEKSFKKYLTRIQGNWKNQAAMLSNSTLRLFVQSSDISF